MAYLSQEAQTITTDNLLAGVVDTFLQERFATLAGQLPFMSTEFASNNWVIETDLADGDSAQNSYSTNVASGTGGRHKVEEVNTRHLARDADTPMKDVNSASNPNNARATYRASAATTLAYDFENEMVNGMGLEPHLHGYEYFLHRYGGFGQPGGNFSYINSSWPHFDQRKIFWCDNGQGSEDYRFPYDPTDSNQGPKPLTLSALDKLLVRDGGMGINALVTTRRTFNNIKQLIRLESGGSTPDVYQSEVFNQRAFSYEGIPVIRLDHSLEGQYTTGVGAKKVADPERNFGVSVSSGSGTKELTVNDPGASADARFLGFTDLDVGRTIELDPDGSGSGPETATIVSVKDRHTADINNLDGSISSHSSEDAVIRKTDHAIYAISFGMDRGFSAMYNPVEDGNANAPADSGVQALTGFRAKDKGELENGRIMRDSFDWFGTFCSKSIWAISRLSHFAPPADVA